MIYYTQVCWERISGKNLATSHLNSIKIWDIRNPNSPQHYINAHPSKIYALDFSPVKENQLVSSAADNTIKMWNVSKPQKPVNILKVRDGSPVWKVKYTVCRRIILFTVGFQSIEIGKKVLHLFDNFFHVYLLDAWITKKCKKNFTRAF